MTESQPTPTNPWEANDPSFGNPRPQPEPRAASTRILLALAWAVLLAGTIYAGVTWWGLPEQVPTHFGPNGQPDTWGSKNQSLITTFVLIGSTLLCLIGAYFPRVHNSPLQYESPEGWQRFYTLSANALAWVSIGVALFIPEIMYSTAQPGAFPYTHFVPLALLLAPLFVYIPAMVKLRNKEKVGRQV